ncbi:MAG: sodium:proton antiporter [Phycisphaerae bacterium]|nr:sodium:proton antiporter [Phycisphaerae bacterium]
MSEFHLFSILILAVLGVVAQWLAWRVGVPSILLLLVFGIAAGPGLGWIRPDELLGPLLQPLVSLSVALILYEGGLTLSLRELPKIRGVLRNLVSIGAAVSWLVSGLAAHWIFGLEPSLAILLGAILVVTGPTVIGPLLRQMRPTGPGGTILKWEGIVIDPIGAILAVLVFEGVSITHVDDATFHLLGAITKAVVFGGGLGLAAAAALTVLLHQRLIPDFLENAVSLMFVVTSFVASNALQHEAGLLATTVMGIALANQKYANVRHIVEFKENLRVLLISALFLLLAARLETRELRAIALPALGFVAVLVFVGRPLSVWVSTLGSSLAAKERWFLAAMAPRGIVAAAVSSVFALRLEDAGFAGGAALVPITFAAIIGTVTVYGLFTPALARRLGVADANPQGVLFVGAQAWVRALAKVLKAKGVRVLLVDTNRENTAAARMEGLPTYSGSILSDYLLDEIDLGGIGRLVAATPNDSVNLLSAQRFMRIFGKSSCYMIPVTRSTKNKGVAAGHGEVRRLFSEEIDQDVLAARVANGAVVKATPLSESFNFEKFKEMYGASAVVLGTMQDGRLQFATAEKPASTKPGQILLALVKEGQTNPPKEPSQSS